MLVDADGSRARQRGTARGTAVSIGIGMAALHEIQGRRHPGNRMGADGERRPDADRRCLHQRRRHRRRGLPGGHDVNRLAYEPGRASEHRPAPAR